MKSSSVILISMPWQRSDSPALQLGLLSAAAKKAGSTIRTFHAAPYLARLTGNSLYWKVANNIHPLLSEGFFGMQDNDSFPHARFEKEIAATEEITPQEYEKICTAVSQFCAMLKEPSFWSLHKVAGFSCTFNQLQASLWAAAQAKKVGCKTIFGGFLAHDDMGKELLAHPCVDTVFSGPGETGFPHWLQQGCPAGFIQASYKGLPSLVPDYDEFFSNSSAEEKEQATLPVEASRGCEYGRCAFCSQNMHRGRYTHRPSNLVASLKLLQRYPCRHLEFADTSFPVALLHDPALCRIMRETLGDIEVFTECRVLSEKDLALFASAGFTSLQTGVESLHSGILKKMCKGTRLLEVIQHLRDSWALSIGLFYNIILDMPCTSESELHEMINLLPYIHHLPPPSALVRFKLQRNSAAYHRPGEFWLNSFAPHGFHDFVDRKYPAFYYTFTNENPLPEELLHEAHDAFSAWDLAFDSSAPLLMAECAPRQVTIRDRRQICGDRPSDYVLEGDAALTLQACKNIKKYTELAQEFNPAQLGSALAILRSRWLILEEAEQVLALPVFTQKGIIPRQQLARDPLDSWYTRDAAATI